MSHLQPPHREHRAGSVSGSLRASLPTLVITTPRRHGEAVSLDDVGDPFANLSAAELALFDAGKVEFEAVETIDEGLGPVFNEASCADLPQRSRGRHHGPDGNPLGGS